MDRFCWNINNNWILIKQNFNIFYNYNYISNNQSIDWEIIDENIDKDWKYDILSGNSFTFMYERYLNKILLNSIQTK